MDISQSQFDNNHPVFANHSDIEMGVFTSPPPYDPPTFSHANTLSPARSTLSANPNGHDNVRQSDRPFQGSDSYPRVIGGFSGTHVAPNRRDRATVRHAESNCLPRTKAFCLNAAGICTLALGATYMLGSAGTAIAGGAMYQIGKSRLKALSNTGPTFDRRIDQKRIDAAELMEKGQYLGYGGGAAFLVGLGAGYALLNR